MDAEDLPWMALAEDAERTTKNACLRDRREKLTRVLRLNANFSISGRGEHFLKNPVWPFARCSRRALLLAALLTVVFVPVTLTGCVHAGIPTKGNVPLAKVDLPRIYGGWYIIAAMPNPLDRGLVGSYDVFSPGQEPLHIHEDCKRKPVTALR